MASCMLASHTTPVNATNDTAIAEETADIEMQTPKKSIAARLFSANTPVGGAPSDGIDDEEPGKSGSKFCKGYAMVGLPFGALAPASFGAWVQGQVTGFGMDGDNVWMVYVMMFGLPFFATFVPLIMLRCSGVKPGCGAGCCSWTLGAILGAAVFAAWFASGISLCNWNYEQYADMKLDYYCGHNANAVWHGRAAGTVLKEGTHFSGMAQGAALAIVTAIIQLIQYKCLA